jgi:glycosyltransferase involved in cell wall biosynthesis
LNTELSIIIVNWNGGELLTRCVETIISSEPRLTYEVVIVDNASSDDSLAELEKSEAGK